MATSKIKMAPPVIETGRAGGFNVAAGGYQDVNVNFTKTFSSAPRIITSIYSTSTAGAIGTLTSSAINVTATGFTARVFNGGTSSRSPAVDWVAIEE